MTSTTTDRRLGVNSGMAVKVPVRAATTTNITLSGEQTVDGVALVTGDRVLVKNQTTGANNGLYDVDTGTWTRTKDFDGAFDCVQGTFVHVISGSTLSGSWWEVSTSDPVIGSTLTFTATLLGDASAVSFLQTGTGAVSRTALSKMRDLIYVEDFGAVGDGVTNDSVAIQAAIDAVNARGGGALGHRHAVYKCKVILKEGVVLVGQIGAFGYLPGGVITRTKYLASAAGVVIDTPAGATLSCGVVGIDVQGLGAATACQGIRFRNVTYGTVKWVNANNFSDEGIVQVAGVACTFEDILAVNCVLNRVRAAKVGAVDIDGTDHFASRIEATISGSTEGTVQSVNLYCVGVMWRATNGFLDSVVGEISDVGIEVTGGSNRLTACRGDLNYGHGINVTGANNQLTSCLGLNNSQDTTNTYDNFIASSASSKNLFVNCRGNDNIAKKARYGFNDQVSSATDKNRYVNCFSDTAVTAQYLTQSSNGSSFSFPSGGQRTFTANTTTPDVTGSVRFATSNSNPTTITDFTGGVQGQSIHVQANDANTTIQHNGATISLVNSGNKKLRLGCTYVFNKAGAVWREVEHFPLGVTADVGNAAKTLQARVDEETQIWATAISADRAVALSVTGVYAGAKFRIVRAATATGAFNLNVGTGPLKAMNTPGSFCDVEYNGTAWVLTAYGVL